MKLGPYQRDYRQPINKIEAMAITSEDNIPGQYHKLTETAFLSLAQSYTKLKTPRLRPEAGCFGNQYRRFNKVLFYYNTG
jgi:hypothetical protein